MPLSESGLRSWFSDMGIFRVRGVGCRWVCHVLYYVVFEVIFNIRKNKTEMEENMSIYYTADFASRGFFLLFTICDC